MRLISFSTIVFRVLAHQEISFLNFGAKISSWKAGIDSILSICPIINLVPTWTRVLDVGMQDGNFILCHPESK